jgi:hypothetical protein
MLLPERTTIPQATASGLTTDARCSCMQWYQLPLFPRDIGTCTRALSGTVCTKQLQKKRVMKNGQ